METKFKLWIAIIFVAIAILMMIVDSAIIFPIVFGLVGFCFACWFYHDINDMNNMTEEELDNFFGTKNE